MKDQRRATQLPGAVRDRVRELRRVRAGDLVPHPQNWRHHPDGQRVVCAELLGQLGYADALLVVEQPDGRLQLIDGHLRAETTPDAVVPVLVLDLNEDEARQVLLSLDPLAMLAETNATARDALLKSANFHTQSVLQELSAAWDRVRYRPEARESLEGRAAVESVTGAGRDGPTTGVAAAGAGGAGSGRDAGEAERRWAGGERDAGGLEAGGGPAGRSRRRREPERAGPLQLSPKYCVLIDCRDEAEQLQLLERLTGEGLTCRALIA